jgi:hypothetical protein
MYCTESEAMAHMRVTTYFSHTGTYLWTVPPVTECSNFRPPLDKNPPGANYQPDKHLPMLSTPHLYPGTRLSARVPLDLSAPGTNPKLIPSNVTVNSNRDIKIRPPPPHQKKTPADGLKLGGPNHPPATSARGVGWGGGGAGLFLCPKVPGWVLISSSATSPRRGSMRVRVSDQSYDTCFDGGGGGRGRGGDIISIGTPTPPVPSGGSPYINFTPLNWI